MTDSTQPPILTSFTPLIAPTAQPFQSYLPTAFSEDMTILQKLNYVINYLNTMTTTVNSALTQMNSVETWALGNGLNNDVVSQLNAWVTDGTLGGMLNTAYASYLQDFGVSVKDHGAKGDGVTDDSSAILSAITYAQANNKKTVFFPSGTYLIVNALSFVGGLNYVGQGGATLKLSVSTSYLNVVTQSSFILDGLTFDANNQVMYALSVTDSSKFTIRNCTFQNATKYGLYLHNGSKGHIEKCFAGVNGRSDFMSSGFSTHGTTIIFRDCEASGNTKGNGFITYSDGTSASSEISYIGCLAKGNSQHGFAMGYLDNVANRVYYLTYEGCLADGNGDFANNIYSGFSLADCYNSKAVGCTSVNNAEHGFVAMDSNGVTFTGNVSRSNKKCGIRLQSDWGRVQDAYSGVVQCVLSDNQIMSNGNTASDFKSSGILIEGNNHYVTANNNIIYGNQYSIYNKTITNYTDNDNVYLINNIIYGQITTNDIQKTVVGSMQGTNYIAGVSTPIS